MNRPRSIWTVFIACSVVLLVVLGWLSLTALQLDQTQREAAQQADLEERIRLALWRMDSALTALFVEESARPANAYRSFYTAERAYTKGDNRPFKLGDVVVPSPLLTFASPNVLLHFQLEADGLVTSPEVPTGEMRQLAQGGYVSPQRLTVFEQRLRAMQTLLKEPVDPELYPVADRGKAQPPLAVYLNGALLERNASEPVKLIQLPEVQTYEMAMAPQKDMPPKGKQAQQFRNTIEEQVRVNLYQKAGQQAAWNINPDQQQQELQQSLTPSIPGDVAGAVVFKSFWLGDALIMARRLPLEGRLTTQACWLNWTNLHNSLLASVADLLPDMQLLPVRQPEKEPGARQLAALPVRLAPGTFHLEALDGWSAVQISLAIAWVCVLLAGVAVALLLHMTLLLSERRAAFVSAVTHELRTPLTTFKMYSEMLADDMVPDPVKRKGYLDTLCSEANRLSHLVENVLAYARLERGSARQRIEKVSLRELIKRVAPRLEQRASQAGMTMEVDSDDPILETRVHVDVSAIEQILFNLVDNACKYAAPTAEERSIHLEALPSQRNGRFAMLRVRDHGQGISAEAAQRLFQPFSKSAHQAARTAPGVGLGLALCRRLSRSLGGDLRWDASVRDGAGFVLALPLSRG